MGTYPKLWTYSVFRFKEYIFGRKSGIRHEMSAFFDDGVAIYAAHSWEAVFSLFEIKIRDFLKNLSFSELLPVRIWIPILQTPQGIPVFASPYLFAIAYDNSTGYAYTTSGSGSFTVTGSNPLLLAGIEGEYNVTFTNPTCSYDSVSLTRTLGQNTNGGAGNYGMTIHALVGPATGSNTFAFASNAAGDVCALISSYSGVSQTGFPDASAQQTATSSTGATQSITVVGTNCWIFYHVYNGSGSISVSSGATLRQQPPSRTDGWIGDTNGTVSAGSNSATWTWPLSTNGGTQAVSFAPAGAVASAATHFLGLLGVGT